VSTLDLTLKVEEEKRMESKTISFAHVRLESPISSKIQECLKGGKKLSISEISKSTGINRNTLKNYLRNHVKAGILVQKGEKKASWYELGGNKI
jgi:predicted HTH transcriptional regulator